MAESKIKKAAGAITDKIPSLGTIVATISGDPELGIAATKATEAAKDAARAAANAVTSNKEAQEKNQEQQEKQSDALERLDLKTSSQVGFQEQTVMKLTGIESGVERVDTGVSELVRISELEAERAANERLDRLEAERERRKLDAKFAKGLPQPEREEEGGVVKTRT